MMASFIIAQCSTLLLVVVVMIVGRPVLRVAGEFATSHFKIYAMAYLKVGCLMTLAMGGTFKETWQSVTSADAARWAVWDWMIHLIAPVLSGVAVLSAFLDRSMQRADEAKEKAGSTRPPFPPIPST